MLGAGGENRTLITCLEGTYISHYTTPADTVLLYPISNPLKRLTLVFIFLGSSPRKSTKILFYLI